MATRKFLPAQGRQRSSRRQRLFPFSVQSAEWLDEPANQRTFAGCGVRPSSAGQPASMHNASMRRGADLQIMSEDGHDGTRLAACKVAAAQSASTAVV